MGGFIKRKKSKEKLESIMKKYGISLDLYKKVEDITVGMQQKAEILKMLYRDNEILIFDEPTAVLTHNETKELMKTMKSFRNEGKTILFSMNFSLQEYHTIDFGGWPWTRLVYFEGFAPGIGGLVFPSLELV